SGQAVPVAPHYTPVPADEDEDAVTTLVAKPPKKTSKLTPWLGGTGLGVVVGVAACVGLWAAGLVPSREQGSPANKNQAAVQSTPAQVAPVPREDARTLLERGDFAQILTQPDQPGAPGDDSRKQHLAARGEARWWSYLQKPHQDRKATDPD